MRFTSRHLSLLLAAVLGAAGLAASALPERVAAATPASAAGGFVTVPTRNVLDTRSGLGGVPKQAVPAYGTVTFTVPGVPAASVLDLHVVEASAAASGWLAAWPSDGAEPTASLLSFTKGQVATNLGLVKVGSSGRVSIRNHSLGALQVAADVSGYFVPGAVTQPGGFSPLPTVNVMDTRSGLGGVAKRAVSGGGAVTFTLAQAPAGSVVALHVVEASAGVSGWLAAWPSDGTEPAASLLSFTKGQVATGLGLVRVGSGGRISIRNHSSGALQVAADISGYFVAGAPALAGGFASMPTVNVMDTRSGLGGVAKQAVAAYGTLTFTVAGAPAGSVVALHVVEPAAGASGWLAAWPSDGAEPAASLLSFTKGQVATGLALVKVGADGRVSIRNHSLGALQVGADTSGYVLAGDLAVPPVSTSHYVTTISDGGSGDIDTMHAEGCQDATAGSNFVLLELGAQSVTPPLSPATPGVLLTFTPSTRLTYAQLRAAIGGYLAGFACVPGAAATIALGTNSSGVFAGTNAYPAEQRGADWAALVNALRAEAPAGLTVVGADDIEAGFAGSEAQAEAWETNYLANTTAELIFNGDLENCPDQFGSAAECGPVAGQSGPTWTRASYVRLTYGLEPGRIRVLPQIYSTENANDAMRWVIVAQASGNKIRFAGSLTEHGVQCGTECAMTPSQGWATLYNTLAIIGVHPDGAATDLQIDS